MRRSVNSSPAVSEATNPPNTLFILRRTVQVIWKTATALDAAKAHNEMPPSGSENLVLLLLAKELCGRGATAWLSVAERNDRRRLTSDIDAL